MWMLCVGGSRDKQRMKRALDLSTDADEEGGVGVDVDGGPGACKAQQTMMICRRLPRTHLPSPPRRLEAGSRMPRLRRLALLPPSDLHSPLDPLPSCVLHLRHCVESRGTRIRA